MADVDERPDGNRYRRLPPRVRPTGTEQDVSPPQPVSEVKYVSALSPAGGVQAYEQLADYMTTAPRRSGRRIVALAILGLGLLGAVVSAVVSRLI
jgi:hypothetical protein